MAAILRGWRKRCPGCGEVPLYRKFLKQIETCPNCRSALGEIRADDLPPYMTIVVVGHIVVPLIVLSEKYYAPPTWLHIITWLPMIVILMLIFLPRLKGCAIGMMLNLGLKGDERQGFEKDD